MHLREIMRNYTRNEMPIYSSETFERMLKEWPTEESLTVYRGMNFSTEKEYKDFMKSIKDNGGYISVAAPGFTPCLNTAIDFSTSPKTYFPTMEIVKGEEKRREMRETLSGYCGVVLLLELPAGEGVDVSISGEGIESEILLRPNTLYKCNIEKIKSLEEQINDKDFNINEYIKEFGSIDDVKTDFIIRNKQELLNDESRDLIVKRRLESFLHHKKDFFQSSEILENKDYVTAIIHDSGRFGENDFKIRFFVPDLKYFDINNLVTKNKENELNEIADSIMDVVLDIHINYREKYPIDYAALKGITPYASDSYIELYKKATAYKKKESYESINDNMRSIMNDRSRKLSQRDKSQLMDLEINKIKDLINGIVNDAPDSKNDVSIEKEEIKKRRNRILNDK